MRNTGYVVNTRGNVAEVVLGEQADCTRCGACLAIVDRKQHAIRAANEIGARVGQKVEVEIAPGRAVLASFSFFILPLVVTFGGAILGYHLARRAVLPPLLGAAILGGGLLVVYFLSLHHLHVAGLGATSATVVRLHQGPSEEQSSERGC
jgi:sigma-E factor negative regulatory protein RseC